MDPFGRNAETQMDSRSETLPVADALRAIAIAFVVADHFANSFPSNEVTTLLVTLALWAVNTFFVLTGFLLAPPYLRAIKSRDLYRFPSSRKFFMRRIYRLYPLYVIAVLFAFLVSGMHAENIRSTVLHLMLIQGLVPDDAGAAFGPLWTMAVDAEFYLILPLLAIALLALTRTLTALQRTIAIYVFIATAIAAALVWRAVVAVTQPGIYEHEHQLIRQVRNVIGMAPAFVLGVSLAAVEMDLGVRRLRTIANPAIPTAAGVCVFAMTYIVVSRNDIITIVVGDALGAISGVLILAALMTMENARTATRLRAAPVVGVTSLAYGVYLVHQPLMDTFFVKPLRTTAAPTVFSIGARVLLVALLIAGMARFLHVTVERPCLWLRARYRD